MSPEPRHSSMEIDKYKDNKNQITNPQASTQALNINVEVSNTEMPQNDTLLNIKQPETLQFSSKSSKCLGSQETEETDEVMLQMEKLFQEDRNDIDLFDVAFCDTLDSAVIDVTKNKLNDSIGGSKTFTAVQKQDSLIENHAAEIKSLDERLASLETIFTNETNNITQDKVVPQRHRKVNPVVKWLCEEYFLKTRYFEQLDQTGDTNTKKLTRVNSTL